jgi:hypothetical protein
MSGPKRSMDVEDVLSSIRRLVSEEAETRKRVAGARTATKTTTKSATIAANSTGNGPQHPAVDAKGEDLGDPEKLVLTSAYRVAAPEDATTEEIALEKRIADIETLVLAETATLTPQATAPEAGDAPATQEVIPSPDTPGQEDKTEAEATPQEPPAAIAADTAAFSWDMPMADFAENGDLDDAPVPSQTSFGKQTQKSFQHIETLVTDAPPDHDQPEPQDRQTEGTSTSAPVDEVQSTEQSSRGPEIVSDDAPTESPVAVNPASADPEPTPEKPVAEIMQTDVQIDAVPDEASERTVDDPFAEPVVASTVVVEPSADFSDTDLSDTDPSADSRTDVTEGSDNFLDEETLRDMVSEMVRSELQGELGDRITRNVRKLVRREIHRALMAKDFD